jgi:hypothetical protein
MMAARPGSETPMPACIRRLNPEHGSDSLERWGNLPNMDQGGSLCDRILERQAADRWGLSLLRTKVVGAVSIADSRRMAFHAGNAAVDLPGRGARKVE